MKRFGRALEREGVDFLLISGQAAVLYGAATFSEDIDLWVNPLPANWRRLLRALKAVRARVHKLTPPLLPRFARKGHGFHFVLPATDGLPAYVDIMGRPPRVQSFGVCRGRAQILDSDWGRLPVVAVEDLVLLKLTRRREDYEVISRLVRIRVCEAETRGVASAAILRWALRWSFSADDLVWMLQRWAVARKALAGLSRGALDPIRRELRGAGRVMTDAPASLSISLEAEISRRRRADTRYWAPIVRELQSLRRDNRLLPEGSAV